jgi:hypothetical protein
VQDASGPRYLKGWGWPSVDVVTSRRADLHGELLPRLGAEATRPLDAELVATSHRPVDRDGQPGLEIWLESLKVGEPLPSLPLWLRGSLCLHVDLDVTDDRTCRQQRILVRG